MLHVHCFLVNVDVKVDSTYLCGECAQLRKTDTCESGSGYVLKYESCKRHFRKPWTATLTGYRRSHGGSVGVSGAQSRWWNFSNIHLYEPSHLTRIHPGQRLVTVPAGWRHAVEKKKKKPRKGCRQREMSQSPIFSRFSHVLKTCLIPSNFGVHDGSRIQE